MKRSTIVVISVCFGLLVFAAARLALYIAYHDYFSSLGFGRVLFSFVNGARFDASVLMLLMGPAALMMLIPVRRRLWRSFWGWFAFAVLAAFALVLVIDVVYFEHAQRHLSTEVRYLSNETDFIASVIKDYGLWLGLFALIAFVFGVCWCRLLRRPVRFERFIWLKMLLCVLLSFIMIRGSFDRKSITTVDAYRRGIVEGTLTINGVFTIYRHWQESFEPLTYYLDNETAISLIGGDSSAKYPLMRTFDGRSDRKNVVLLIMESWSAYYMGVLNDHAFDVTPNFDRLSADGALFRRHFGAERRTIDGVQALITGIPPIDSIGNLGYGLEVKASGGIGKIALENGYETILMQTSRRRSYYMDAVANSLGFRHYYGAEDIPIVMDYPDPSAAPYGWDFDGLMRLEEVIDSRGDKPFLAVFISGTTHPAYPPLYPPFDRYENVGQGGLLNTLEYSDYSVGEFIRKASEKEWFKDTVFIITADHASTAFSSYPSFEWVYRTPLLIYSPGNIKPAEYTHITSHLDMLPTVVELAGMKGEASTVGRNVFDSAAERYAFLGSKGVQGIISGQALVEVRENRIVSSGNPDSRLIGEIFTEGLLESTNHESMEYKELEAARRVMALVQTVDVLINSGRWNAP